MIAAIGGAVLATALLTGCGVSKPTMKLRSAYITGVVLPGNLQLTCEMDVTNPNSYDVAIRGLRGTVLLAGRHQVPVDFRAPGNGVWMPAGRTTTVSVPVQIPLFTAGAIGREFFNSSSVPFTFSGRADVTATSTFQFERDDYVIEEQGTIPTQQLLGGGGMLR